MNIIALKPQSGARRVPSDSDLLDFYEILNKDLPGSIDEMSSFAESIQYSGFDPEITRQKAMLVFEPVSILKLCMIGSLRGSKAAFRRESPDASLHATLITKEVRGSGGGEDKPAQTLRQLIDQGLIKAEKNSAPASVFGHVSKKSDDLTLQRLVAAFPDLTAYGLRTLEEAGMLTKRIPESAVPAYLQFPSAAGISMSAEQKEMMKDFQRSFSGLIKGEFREEIFDQQTQRAIALNAKNPVHGALVKINNGAFGSLAFAR